MSSGDLVITGPSKEWLARLSPAPVSSIRRRRGQQFVGCPAAPIAVPSAYEPTVEAAVYMIRRRSIDPRLLVDVIVAGVVTVLSVVDVAAASEAGRRAQRPADALAFSLVIAGSLSLFVGGVRRSRCWSS